MFIKPKGTQDIYKNISVFRFVENQFIKTVKLFNYLEIRTPIFEDANLFASLGQESDIVQKELYQFNDKANRKLALRPEGTASVIRAFIENKMYIENNISKLFYIGSMFRYERPQKGRKREFSQIGIEQIGPIDTYAIADTIIMADFFLKSLLLKNYLVVLNNLGSFKQRKQYINDLKEYFKNKLNDLCSDCQKRFAKNPLRLLDCKVDKISPDTPNINSYLSEKSKKEFAKLKEILKKANVKFKEDNNLVRGLDYYTNVVFEFIPNNQDGSQSTILAGGQYSGLVKKLGGNDIDGIGFAAGVDRIVNLLLEKDHKLKEDNLDVYICTQDSWDKVNEISSKLRQADIKCDFSFNQLDVKKQFKKSNQNNTKWVILIEKNQLTLKSQNSNEVIRDNIENIIKKIKESK